MFLVWPRGPARKGLLVAGLASLLTAASAWAAGPSTPLTVRIIEPAAGQHLVAGTLTTVRWSALPAEVEEFELLLLDGGRSSSIRLTPRTDPSTRELSWRVPNLPTQGARLRLRVGVQGEEIESEPSAPFVIIGSRDAPTAALYLAEGERWTLPIPPSPTAEPPLRGAGLRHPDSEHPELAAALLHDDNHLSAFASTVGSAALPAAPVTRPAPGAWSDPARPVEPPQRE